MPEDRPTTESKQIWTWTDTKVPAEPILTIFVRTELVTIDAGDVVGNKPKWEVLAVGATPYSPPTKFSELDPAFGVPDLNHLGVSDWDFIGETISGAVTQFHFFKHKTAQELATPYESVPITGNHFWPQVLEDVYEEIDDSVQQSSNVIEGGHQGIRTAPTVHLRDALINSVKEGSTIITEKFLSSTQPPRRVDKVPQPQPVSVIVNGERKDYEEVLHDDLRFGPTPSGTRQFLSTGSTRDVGGSLGEQFYPRTNFPDWAPHVISRQSARNQYGLWETTVIKVRPPKRQSTTR